MGIYVWGTGCGASELLEAGLELSRITAFIDSYPSGDTFLGKPVLLPRHFADCELLIITTRHAQAVAQTIAALGIPRKNCLFLKNNYQLTDWNEGSAAESILGRTLLEKLLPRQRIIPVPSRLADSALPERDLENDYVRLATLELLCRRLAPVPGAAAELGVYKGFFARCINMLLPERKLYLFDSFQGFDTDEATRSFQAAHENTSVQQVLSLMPHRETVILKPGFFPDSLGGLEETFCLVSLDVDFEEATLEGLRYFWPRLSPGGYLMLHDWGSLSLPGVARALARYESEIGQSLAALPLCDVGGSLVLCKE